VNLAELRLLRSRYQNWPELALGRWRAQRPRRVVLRDGLVIESAPGDLLGIAEEIFFAQVYAPRGFEIGPADVVVDIGANVVAFTLYAARRTQRTVYAYEPFPGNLAFLERNVRRNGLHNALLRNQAVCERAGVARLFLSESPAGHLLFDRNLNGPLEHYVEVPATTLAELIEEHGLQQIDLLKLDCEGAEGAILGSAQACDLRRVRRIALEFHDNVSSLDHRELDALLRGHGFQTRLRWDGRSPFGYLYALRAA
jgi:FkbM family methyltransferase